MKKLISFLTVLAVIFSITMPASFIVYADSSHTLKFSAENGSPLQGINIRLFQIASSVNGSYVPAAAFAAELEDEGDLSDAVSSGGENRRLSEQLKASINGKAAAASATTGANGKADVNNLQAGLYLVLQGESQNGRYIMMPFIVPVPHTEEIKPKIEEIPPPPPPATTEPTTTTRTDDATETTTTEAPTQTTTTEAPQEPTNEEPTAPSSTTAPPQEETTRQREENPTVPVNATEPPPEPTVGAEMTTVPAITEPATEQPTVAGRTEPVTAEVIDWDFDWEEDIDMMIPLINGWFAEYNEEEDIWYIYNEHRELIGFIRLPEGEDIEFFDVEGNLIPLIPFFGDDDTPPSPKTGDSIIMVTLFVLTAAYVTVTAIRKKKNADNN